MSPAPRRTQKICKCGRPVTSTANRATRCELCKSSDPHRHDTRSAKVEEIVVSIDLEGIQIGDIMHKASVSFAREDGSKASLSAPEGRYLTGAEICRWLLDNCTGPYTDVNGNPRKQAPVAFHFPWDSCVIAKDFMQAKDITIIRKSTGKVDEPTVLCNSTHRDGEPCGRLHRWNRDTALKVVSDGERDLLVLDKATGFAITFTERRRFYIEYRPNGDYFKDARVLDIHDTGSSFVGGLLKVIADWRPELTVEELAAIEWGKQARKDGFLTGTRAEIEAYSEAECIGHARCVRKLVDALRAALHFNLKVSDVYGSGSIASAAFKRYKVPTRMQTHLHVSSETVGHQGVSVEDLGYMTYFGGLIETPVVGFVPGVVDEVDINSAYPAQAVKLPCMRAGHGKWIEKTRMRAQDIPDWATVGYVKAVWAVDSKSTPPFSVRMKNGNVRCPQMAIQPVWVTLPEFRTAVKRFGTIEVKGSAYKWWQQTCNCPPPFAFLEDAYYQRLQIKDKMNQCEKGSAEFYMYECLQLAIKLVINSCYGKLAQQRPTLGRYTNMHYASFITGATRGMVREMSWRREDEGGTVLYQHTDSVISQGGSPEDEGSALGAWGKESKVTEDFLILQPGLAIGLTSGKRATRGVNATSFDTAARVYKDDNDFGLHPTEWAEIPVQQDEMMSWGRAVARNCIERAGSFYEVEGGKKIKPISAKRSFRLAEKMECGTAWMVPPIEMVEPDMVATLDDIKVHRSAIDKLLETGDMAPIGLGL